MPADRSSTGVRTPYGARMVSVGSYLPERVVPVAEAAADYGVDPEWVLKRTQVAERHFAAEGETVSAMVVEASKIALERAGVAADEIDLILLGTSTAEYQCPGSSTIVQDALGATGAGALDIGAACTGWLAGVSLAAAMIEAGRAETVLVTGAEIVSQLLGPDDVSAGLLMADGAGAVVMRRSAPDETGIGPAVIHAEGQYADLVTAVRVHPEHGRPIFTMSGQETYTVAVRSLVDATREVLELAGDELDDIDLFVYHQANGRILRAVGDRLQLPPEKTISIVERTGNTSAASIPIALDDAYAAGRLVPGQKVLMAAVGAGFVTAAAIVTWG